MGIPKIKITIIEKLNMADVHPSGEGGAVPDFEPVCPMLQVGDQFIADVDTAPPGFCPAAFDDIYRYISGLRFGANYPWMARAGTATVCCTDGLRPVIFRLERME